MLTLGGTNNALGRPNPKIRALQESRSDAMDHSRSTWLHWLLLCFNTLFTKTRSNKGEIPIHPREQQGIQNTPKG